MSEIIGFIDVYKQVIEHELFDQLDRLRHHIESGNAREGEVWRTINCLKRFEVRNSNLSKGFAERLCEYLRGAA